MNIFNKNKMEEGSPPLNNGWDKLSDFQPVELIPHPDGKHHMPRYQKGNDGQMYDMTDPEQAKIVWQDQTNRHKIQRLEDEVRQIDQINATIGENYQKQQEYLQSPEGQENQRLQDLATHGNVIASAELGYAVDLSIKPTFADILAVYRAGDAKIQTVMRRYEAAGSPISMPKLTQINGLNQGKQSLSVQTDQGKFYIPTTMNLDKVKDQYQNNYQGFTTWVQQQINEGNVTI
jgi:hypothetical protein